MDGEDKRENTLDILTLKGHKSFHLVYHHKHQFFMA